MAFVCVLNVGHGSCVSLLADDGKRWLFDCGHDGTMRPSAILSGNTISRLFVMNYDEDHISDLPELRKKCGIEVLTCNPSITPHELAALKLQSGPLSEAMRELLVMRGWVGIGGFGPLRSPVALDAEGVSVTLFCNRYGEHNPELGTFADTNNISLVAFLQVHGLRMLLAGDLEKAGWLALLRDPRFRAELSTVNVFLASHHGRENGYCEEVFDYCAPEIVVMSDGSKRHDTQEMTGTYATKASGCRFRDGTLRKVLTTRKDGTISFTASRGGTTIEISGLLPPAPAPFSALDALASPPPLPRSPFDSLSEILDTSSTPSPFLSPGILGVPKAPASFSLFEALTSPRPPCPTSLFELLGPRVPRTRR